MKTTIFRRKTPAFFGAAAILLAAVFTIGCKTEISSDPAPETFTVEMKAGEHGTLSANPVIPASGKVAKDTVITFTAAPASGYKVDKWTITGGAFETGTGTEGSLTAKVKISANTKVNVSFKAEVITPPSPTEFTVQTEAGEHGTLSANPVIPASGKVAKDTVITFTADPASGYKVDKWTITGGTFEAGTGTEESLTAKVKISVDTKVSVSFKEIAYNTVSFADLKTYLKDTASSTDINYIKVTGLTAADLKGESSSKPSAIGKILKDNPSKKVALKLDEVSGLTDMSYCFSGCTSLTQAPVIPSSVTNMNSCFYYCTSLTQAPEIPSSVTNMNSCFYNCTSLTQAPVIPSSVTNMDRCFCYCTSLTQAPVIPSSVTNMSWCFCYCTSLTQAPVIPSSVTYMSGCFCYCTSLTQAPMIPSSVTYMELCFCKCTSLTQAPEIPNSVTNMKRCFEGCKEITAVTLKCNYRDPAFKDAFKDCEKLTAGSIKVPAGQLQTYKDNAGTMDAQENWFVAGE